MAEYVKEFEQYIINDHKEESLLTIIPGSSSDRFLQITQKLRKVAEEFPQSVFLL